MPSKILVLGAGGLVGSQLATLAAARGFEADCRSHAECDITLPGSVERELAGRAFEAVVNCAAYNAVDRAESEPEAANLVNGTAAGNVAAAAHGAVLPIVHYSTDFVFDGRHSRPYLETDVPDPISAYGRSKLLGDEAVRNENRRHFILRVSCLYGASGFGFGSTVAHRLRTGERVQADGERRIQPTWAQAVADQTLALLPTDRFGLYHATCHGETSWADFAVELARLAGFDARLVEAVATGSFRAPAQRPRYAVLENRGLSALGLDRMPSWQTALQGYLEELGGRSP